MLGASSTNGARGRAVRRLCAPAAGVTKKVMNVSACLAGASTGRWVEAGPRGGQAAVVDVVAVEVEGAVLARREPPVVHGAAPVHAGHAATRQLVQQAVHAVGRAV